MVSKGVISFKFKVKFEDKNDRNFNRNRYAEPTFLIGTPICLPTGMGSRGNPKI